MLRIQPLCAYLTTTDGIQWRREDYDARFVALAVKGKLERLRGYYNCPLTDGTSRRINPDADGRDFLRENFGSWAADKLRGWGYTRPTIVPVPNSSVTPDSPVDFETAKIAQAVAAGFGNGASVAPILRFREPLQPASEGGPRGALYLQTMMVVTDERPIRQLVLLDDIVTTGNHLKAAKARLATLNNNISHAVVCAESTPHQLANPFAVAGSDLENPLGGFFEDVAPPG